MRVVDFVKNNNRTIILIIMAVILVYFGVMVSYHIGYTWPT